MSDETVQQVVARAVNQAYDDWAKVHPCLSAVIDQVRLTGQAVESLRDSQQYRDALAAYHQGLSELDLLRRLTEIAGPIVAALLAG